MLQTILPMKPLSSFGLSIVCSTNRSHLLSAGRIIQRGFQTTNVFNKQYDITKHFQKTVKLLEKNPLAWVVGKDQGEFIFRLPPKNSDKSQDKSETTEGLDFISLNTLPRGLIAQDLSKQLTNSLETEEKLTDVSYSLLKHELIDPTTKEYKLTPIAQHATTTNLSALITDFTDGFLQTNPPSISSNQPYYSQSIYRTSKPTQFQFQLAQNLIQKTMAYAQESTLQSDFRRNVIFVTHLFTPEPCNQGMFDDLIFSFARCGDSVDDQLKVLDRWCALIIDTEKVMKRQIGEVKGRGIKFDEELQYWGTLVGDEEVLGKVCIERS